MFRTRGGRYTKAEVAGVVSIILIDYGARTLLPMLKVAVDIILENLHTEEVAGQETAAEGNLADTPQPSKRRKTTRAAGKNFGLRPQTVRSPLTAVKCRNPDLPRWPSSRQRIR